ncbi:MAG: hypothetical protein EPO16_09505 [Dehalococcoidia bacterium]|nr:MAG: hypothetical protein EPO16_09505 [Dehalococcoidia bacterium]
MTEAPGPRGRLRTKIERWRKAFSNVDWNAARNVLNANAKALVLKEPRPAYEYAVSSEGKRHVVSVGSSASVSGFKMDRARESCR